MVVVRVLYYYITVKNYRERSVPCGAKKAEGIKVEFQVRGTAEDTTATTKTRQEVKQNPLQKILYLLWTK